MSDRTLIVLIILVAALALIAILFFARKRPPAPSLETRTAPGFEAEDEQPEAPAEITYATTATEEIADQTWKLAFGVNRFDYQIFGEHADVLARVARAIESAAHQSSYFPRRPMLLPKLLQALNNSDSTRQELSRLLLGDPTLADATLKRANNAAYRTNAEPIESLNRALVILGVDGLKSLIATAIMQPVFRLPKGFFDHFADVTWELAQRSAVAAEAHAKATREVDPFVAQLLGLLRSLANIVLFRLTLDKYRESPNSLPRAEVFIRAIQTHRDALAVELAKSWSLSDASIQAFDEQRQRLAPQHMSPMGRAVYYGELCGVASLAAHHQLYSPEGAQAILIAQGLKPATALLLMRAADGSE